MAVEREFRLDGKTFLASSSTGMLFSVLLILTWPYETEAPVTTFPPISCLEGRGACAQDKHCNIMLEAVPRICKITNRRCTPKERLQCRAVQKWLQLTSLFHGCHCNVSRPHKADCISLRRSVLLDYCRQPPPYQGVISGRKSKDDYGVSRRRSRVGVVPRERAPIYQSYTYEGEDDWVDDPDDEEDAEEEDDEDEEGYEEAGQPDDKISCIGVRKRCLVDRQCQRTLTDFRRLCRENKKKAECVATDREGCFKMIQDMKKTGIFECNCRALTKYRPLKKCERIQYRLANNTCLETVPYLIHSRQSLVTSYDDLLNIVSSTVTPPPGAAVIYTTRSDARYHHLVRESTCVEAFTRCNADSECRLRMAEFMNTCSLNQYTDHCNRKFCLSTTRKFYSLVRPELTRDLLFCQCVPGDVRCEAVRQGLYPTCSVLENPPPTCLHVVQRCTIDPECRHRWLSYKASCAEDSLRSGCAQGVAQCQNALVAIMGTILTTNCTCRLPLEGSIQECNEAKRSLHQNNVCKETSFDDYNKHRAVTTTQTVHFWQDTVSRIPMRRDCLRSLGHRIPSYMSIPSAVRMYHNDSECSDICQCMSDGKLKCKRLPCSPSLSCKERTMVYAHGSAFVRADRGQCRCIKAEVVCARPVSIRQKHRTGLFLHVGYSIADRFLVEGNSDVKFDPVKTAAKLGTLLNGDTAGQFCRLTLYYQEEGNLLFEIKLSQHTTSSEIAEVCENPTKALSYMINARHSTIVTDAELSILKVAEMEMVERLNRPLRSDYASAVKSSPFHGLLPLALCLAFTPFSQAVLNNVLS